MPYYGFGDPLLEMAIDRSGLTFLQNGFPQHFSTSFGRGSLGMDLNDFGRPMSLLDGGNFQGRGRDLFGYGRGFDNGYYGDSYGYNRGYDRGFDPFGSRGSFGYDNGRFTVQLMDGVVGGAMNHGPAAGRAFDMVARDLSRAGIIRGW